MLSGPPVVHNGVQLGKFASLVKMSNPDVQTIAQQVCQHVIGLNPKLLGEWNAPPPLDKKAAKKKKKENSSEDNEPKENVREVEVESKLLDQEFLLESKKSVRDFLKDSGPRVLDFVRIECGEDLGEDV